MKTGNHPDKRGILDELFLGFDPGGNGNYGVALLAGPRASTATVQNIEEAINWTTEGRTLTDNVICIAVAPATVDADGG